ncbi:ATP synthase F1 subunit delta [Entomobacter blattae]|uniref:ATP synthase subunit delta n=1 Tax=Entomobacter blattae TaxID=2762277 RepID=A0A7H1NPX0_9PROT|nr:ATP synthase F1 subunit delta [Entomobacter blattae]QNT77830.1 ATP synthase subunit delta [Entomobacter blattae]
MVSNEIAVAPSGFVAGSLFGRYATALYDVATEHGKLDEVIEEAQALYQIIEQSSDLRNLLNNRTIQDSESQKAIMAILAHQGFGIIIKNFMGVIIQNRRLPLTEEFLQVFLSLVALRRGVAIAEVISATPLSDVQKAQIQARLVEAGYSRVSIQEKVEKSLLGGLVLRIGSRLYDASLKTRISQLHEKMKGAA